MLVTGKLGSVKVSSGETHEFTDFRKASLNLHIIGGAFLLDAFEM